MEIIKGVSIGSITPILHFPKSLLMSIVGMSATACVAVPAFLTTSGLTRLISGSEETGIAVGVATTAPLAIAGILYTSYKIICSQLNWADYYADWIEDKTSDCSYDIEQNCRTERNLSWCKISARGTILASILLAKNFL